MKKISKFCIFVLVLSFLSKNLFAINYCKDFLEPGNPGGWSASLKTFEDEWTMDTAKTVNMDIWINDCPENMLTAGFWLNYNTAEVSVLSVEVYDGTVLPGPWDSGLTTIIPEASGPGTYFVACGNLACVVPDGGGDIVLGRVQFRCESPGDAAIQVQTIPGFDTVVGCAQPSVLYDPVISPNTVTIHQIECNVDAECDDGNVCTNDSCNTVTHTCVYDLVPDDTSCDDGFYCNGIETCQTGECVAGTPPCPPEDPPNECTDDCNEDTDTCYVCNATSFSDPCCANPACVSEEICLIIITDFYVNGTTGDNANDGLTPGTAWKTITHALSTIPTLITLDDNNRANIHVAASTYDTVMGGGDAETFPLMMKEYISLFGSGQDVTTIDAQQTAHVIEFPKEEDIQNVTVDGFTITGGYNFRGGGITVLWADPVISNCNIRNNTAYAINGGGIYLQRSNATIFNCIISENIAPQQRGGGISVGNESSPIIKNCTIVGNGAGCDTEEGGGGISVGNYNSATVINTILWGNYRDCSPNPELNQILVQEYGAIDITYSCIQGGYIGEGNTDEDPKFFGTGYHLMYGSSCIDSATSDGAPDSDLNGNSRYDHLATPNTGAGAFPYYDMGAYEYQGDSDGDGILDDGDESGVVGDNPCTGGATENCDDNCTFIPNPDQADGGDGDGAGDVCDNCPQHPNAVLLGTCAKQQNENMVIISRDICVSDDACEENEFCEMSQRDSNGNGIGDVCECEGDFDCDGDVDGSDAIVFKNEYGRNQFNNPCTVENPCVGDFDGDGDVDGSDAAKFKEDFGRNEFNNPCPACP